MEKYVILRKLNLIAAFSVVQRALWTGWACRTSRVRVVIPADGRFTAQSVHSGSDVATPGRLTIL